MTIQDRVGLVGTIVMAFVSAPFVFAEGRAFLKGRQVGERDYRYYRWLDLINMRNALTGVPLQKAVYAWQWRVLGYIEIGIAILLWLWAPVALFLLIRGLTIG